ncbi:MAG: hypothetical protein ACQEQG_01800 [Bacillota bacterium]
MWQIVYIAHSEDEAREIDSALSARGFLIQIEELGEEGFQIKTTESEAEEVYEFLNEHF